MQVAHCNVRGKYKFSAATDWVISLGDSAETRVKRTTRVTRATKATRAVRAEVQHPRFQESGELRARRHTWMPSASPGHC